MVWVGLSMYGATEPYFFERNESINTAVYCNKLLPFAKRESVKLFGQKKFIFQQDGATAHTAERSQNLCKRLFGSFIEKKRWPPNSPDLNPLDYFYWNAVQSKMIIKNLSSRESLIQEIRKACKLVSLSQIRSAVSKFNTRIKEVEKQNGGRIIQAHG